MMDFPLQSPWKPGHQVATSRGGELVAIVIGGENKPQLAGWKMLKNIGMHLYSDHLVFLLNYSCLFFFA